MLLLQVPQNSGGQFDLKSVSPLITRLTGTCWIHQASSYVYVYTIRIKNFAVVSWLVISARVRLERGCQQVKDDEKF